MTREDPWKRCSRTGPTRDAPADGDCRPLDGTNAYVLHPDRNELWSPDATTLDGRWVPPVIPRGAAG